MARRVYFHIGVPKSGTTYLQNLMAANRSSLARQGVLYADGTSPRDRVWATEVLRGIDLSKHPKPQAQGAWDRIVGQVRGYDGDCVISHEFFGACSHEQAARALTDLEPAEVHLVLTARDYVRQAAAVWQERLKYGFATPFSEFTLDDENLRWVWSWRTQDIVQILGRWQHSIPPEHVHVVTVPAPGGPTDALWVRFATVIGVDPASCTTGLGRANISLGLVESELLRRVDEKIHDVVKGPRERARWIRDLLADGVLSQGSRERFSLSSEYGHELAHRSRAAVEEIRRARLHVVGSLDDLLPPDPLPVTRTPEDATTEELLEAAISAIVGLVGEAKSASERHAAALRGARKPPGGRHSPADARPPARRTPSSMARGAVRRARRLLH